MSRIGRMPIAIPAGVKVDIAENNHVTVTGPKGTLVRILPSEMELTMDGETVVVTRPNDLKRMKSLHGLTRTLLNNMVVGVSEGYKKSLEIQGVGYKFEVAGPSKLVLAVGFSHKVDLPAPKGITIAVDEKEKNIIHISAQYLNDKINYRFNKKRRLIWSILRINILLHSM